MSRKGFRTQLVAVSMCFLATTMAFTACASPAAPNTPPDSKPAVSSSMPSSSLGGSGPVIDNTNVFTWKKDAQKYDALVKGASNTGQMTGSGHRVYQDSKGKFIISGDSAVYLDNDKIPAASWEKLRQESTGNRIYVMTGSDQNAKVTAWMQAWSSAVAIRATPASGSARILLNNFIVGGNLPAVVEGGNVYVPANAVCATKTSNVSFKRDGTQAIVNVLNPLTGKSLEYVIDSSSPGTISERNGEASLHSDEPLVFLRGSDVYFNASALAQVFDWTVTVKGDGSVTGKFFIDIVTDGTLANGTVCAAEGCEILVSGGGAGGSSAQNAGVTEEEASEAAEKAASEAEEAVAAAASSAASSAAAPSGHKTEVSNKTASEVEEAMRKEAEKTAAFEQAQKKAQEDAAKKAASSQGGSQATKPPGATSSNPFGGGFGGSAAPGGGDGGKVK